MFWVLLLRDFLCSWILLLGDSYFPGFFVFFGSLFSDSWCFGFFFWEGKEKLKLATQL